MHEMPITESILNIVLKHAMINKANKVVAIHLEIGKLSDLEDEWLQRYFDYLSKGTIAEGAKLQIERMPIRLECNACAKIYTVEAVSEIDTPCPHCGKKDVTLISGREYFIKNMEVL